MQRSHDGVMGLLGFGPGLVGAELEAVWTQTSMKGKAFWEIRGRSEAVIWLIVVVVREGDRTGSGMHPVSWKESKDPIYFEIAGMLARLEPVGAAWSDTSPD
jgi:hypothetical protein